MNYPTAAGTTDLASLIPTIWAPKAQMKFYSRTIMAQIANTAYEGLISKQGDKVTINNTPDITINDHVMGQDLSYEQPTPSDVDLLIDKGKSYSFAIPDIGKKQSIINFLEDWSEDASKQMKIAIERSIFADVYADAAALNQGASAGKLSGDIDLGSSGSPVALTNSNAAELIIERAGVVLDEQDVDDDNRWIVLPAWACARLKTDLKDASMTGDGKSTIRTGLVGMVDRFKVYQSNLLYKTVADSADNVLFGTNQALTFASQLVINESVKAQSTFGDLFRGLQVYGYKVVKPEAMGRLYIDKA